MIKVALCDDSSIRLQEKKAYLECCKHDLLIEWDVFSYEKFYSIELLQLAMEFSIFIIHKDMKKINGIELAKRIRSINKKALIVLMAEDMKNVLNVFDVVIFDYLIEPISKKKFYEMLEKAVRYFGIIRNPFRYQCFQKINSIEQEYIIFFEKNKRKVWIHTLSGVKECYMTTNSILKQLNSEMFCRCHQSYIVNFYFVEKIGTASLELINGTKIDVSRTYKGIFRDKYFEYLSKKS